jgi:hypothetical protein
MVLAIPSEKWKERLLLHIMSNMFSFDNLLKFFVEGEDELSPKEQIFFEGIEEEKKNCYLKFGEGLNNNIVCAMCNSQNTHQLKLIHYALNPRS